MIDTSTGYSDGKNIARHLPIQLNTDFPFITFLDGETKIVVMAVSTNFDPGLGLNGSLGVTFQRFAGDQSFAPEKDFDSFSIPGEGLSGTISDRRVIRHVVDISDMGTGTSYDLTNSPVFLGVTGSNIQNTQIQVTVHRNVGAVGSLPAGAGLGNIIETGVVS
jgi:hypothetical protein